LDNRRQLAPAFAQIRLKLKMAGLFLALTLLSALGIKPALADCQIADANLEEAILNKPGFRGPANRQTVRDLRTLRDTASALWSYGRHDDGERLLAHIRERVASPSHELKA
jgi:hypothetical protein